MEDRITIDEFAAVALKVGTVVSAEEVAGSEKLLSLQVAIGDEVRTILSGIRQYYEPGDLEGRRCVIVANLMPRKMMGMESNGMLVCVSYTDDSGEEVVAIVEPPTGAPNGTRLS